MGEKKSGIKGKKTKVELLKEHLLYAAGKYSDYSRYESSLASTEEEYDEEIKKMAERYQMEADKVDELLSDDDKKNFKADICARKAAKLVVEAAK